MMRIPSGESDLIDDWDPQGLNSLAKDELESFSSDEDPEAVLEDEIIDEGQEEGEDVYSSDLDRDGLTELEEMERSLLAEEHTLDFAMVGEEE